MRLPDKIILLRKQNGWSQEELAEKLNVSRQAVSRWENGTALPDAQNVLQLSKLFHVTTDYLLNDDYESDGDIPLVQQARQETEEQIFHKKKMWLISMFLWIIAGMAWLVVALENIGKITCIPHFIMIILDVGLAVRAYLHYSKI